MLEIGTSEEWDSAFQNARRIICFLPSLVEKLEKIHDLPSICIVERWKAWGKLFL
jgi:hypothetical protein